MPTTPRPPSAPASCPDCGKKTQDIHTCTPPEVYAKAAPLTPEEVEQYIHKEIGAFVDRNEGLFKDDIAVGALCIFVNYITSTLQSQLKTRTEDGERMYAPLREMAKGGFPGATHMAHEALSGLHHQYPPKP